MKKHYLIASFVIVLALLGGVVAAQDDTAPTTDTEDSEPRLTFPIDELGGCSSKEECREYCSQEENKEACMTFAEYHNLVPRERIQKFKEHHGKVAAILEEQVGPGGCTSVRECRQYCSEEENRAECLQFGLDNGLLPPQAAERAKQIIALRTNGGPGGCQSPGECRLYCSESINREECIAFAEEHNLLSEEQLLRIEQKREQVESRLEGRTGPGGCMSKEECRLYCDDPEHVEECIDFGQKEGLLERGEVERTLRMLRDGEFDEYRQRFEQRRGEFELRLDEARRSHEGFRTDLRTRLQNTKGFENTEEQRLRLQQELENRDIRVRTQYEERLRDGYRDQQQNNEDVSSSNSSSIIQFISSLLGL